MVVCTNSNEVRDFVALWLVAPSGGRWEDQSAFIDLMRKPHFRDLLTILPNRFNCLERHMEASNPVIRAFHGDPDREQKLRDLMGSMKLDQRPRQARRSWLLSTGTAARIIPKWITARASRRGRTARP
jgi:hypothetical protein